MQQRESLKFKSLIKTITLSCILFIYLFGSASDFFFAGTDTPSTQITWALFYVIKYPDVQARLHRELDNVVGAERLPELSDKPNLSYLDAFLNEMVRIVSETPLAIPHLTMRETSLAGFYIPQDMTVIVNLWAIHHDLEYWEDPFTFRPDRFLDKEGRLGVHGILPFSAGIRSCPGERFGKKAVFLFLSRLLHRFKFECPEGEELPAEEDSDLGILRNCKPFKIRAITRN